MKLYLIGGLGADERVFKYLNLDCPTQVIKCIIPYPNEDLDLYVKRLTQQIDQHEQFSFLGVSFGGIIALELAKITNPVKVILISSVETSSQLPRLYLSIGKTGLLNLIPSSMMKLPNVIMYYLFSAKDKNLLGNIIKDTDPEFIKWALKSILKWSNSSNHIKPIRIHGTRDRVIPLKGEAIKIKDGGHFMIVDNAKEISRLVNEQMNEERKDKHCGTYLSVSLQK